MRATVKIFMGGNLLVSGVGCYAYLLCRTVFIFIISILSGETVRIVKALLQNLLNETPLEKKRVQTDGDGTDRRKTDRKDVGKRLCTVLPVMFTIILMISASAALRWTDEVRRFQLSSLTDSNWTNGYSNTADILLFEYNNGLLKKLFQGEKVKCGDKSFEIKDIDYDDKWIRVTVDENAGVCRYPNYIQIE